MSMSCDTFREIARIATLPNKGSGVAYLDLTLTPLQKSWTSA
jgi:hypothetical protein